jgi:hypothetical protein
MPAIGVLVPPLVSAQHGNRHALSHFDSMQLKRTEKNYPVHEKEMLVIILALKKWHSDLMGTEFTIYTDHKTLENF